MISQCLGAFDFISFLSFLLLATSPPNPLSSVYKRKQMNKHVKKNKKKKKKKKKKISLK